MRRSRGRNGRRGDTSMTRKTIESALRRCTRCRNTIRISGHQSGICCVLVESASCIVAKHYLNSYTENMF